MFVFLLFISSALFHFYSQHGNETFRIIVERIPLYTLIFLFVRMIFFLNFFHFFVLFRFFFYAVFFLSNEFQMRVRRRIDLLSERIERKQSIRQQRVQQREIECCAGRLGKMVYYVV